MLHLEYIDSKPSPCTTHGPFCRVPYSSRFSMSGNRYFGKRRETRAPKLFAYYRSCTTHAALTRSPCEHIILPAIRTFCAREFPANSYQQLYERRKQMSETNKAL